MVNFPELPKPLLERDPAAPFASNGFSWRLSDSSLVEWVWTARTPQDATYTVAADGCLDLVVLKQNGLTKVRLSGPTTQAYTIPVLAGTESICIRLKPGVYLEGLPSEKIIDLDTFLPNAGSKGFWLEERSFSFPKFHETELFVEKLAKLGILHRSALVKDALAGELQGVNVRTLQRHFLKTAGITPYLLFQIQRAEKAARLIEQGVTLSEVAYQVGYSDQPHMTRSLKRFTGKQPKHFQRD